jgi:hypothetical protein
MDLAREARQPGWWTQYSDLQISSYIGLKQAAVHRISIPDVLHAMIQAGTRDKTAEAAVLVRLRQQDHE